jgi:aminopeptidase
LNGVISYNASAEHENFVYERIRFEFEKGRIVKATANDTQRLNRVLDADEGARYVGEFALGLNPHINRVMKEALSDEKIAGSLHFTPGNSYDDALVRKDGRFTLPELLSLNPENLTSL